MRYTLQLVLALTAALWFGGLVATFLFGADLFLQLPRSIAGPAASMMFVVFGKYQMIVAALAILSCGLLLTLRPAPVLLPLLLLLVLAGCLALTTTLGFMPIMQNLRARGQVDSPEFQSLHHRSVVAMSTEAVLLLLATALLPAAIIARPSPTLRGEPGMG